MKKTCFFFLFLSMFSISFAAKKLTPWYTGPLLAPAANNVAPGAFCIQPYLFVTDNLAHYNSYWHHTSSPNNITIHPLGYIQFGLNDFLDFSFIIHALYQEEKKVSVFQYAETTLELGIQILKDHGAVPSLRFTIAEKIPTGKYQKLHPNKLGLDGVGTGSFETSIGCNISKIFYWMARHPICLRLCFSYFIPSLVHIQDFNYYGGGWNTNGKIRPPSVFITNFSFEWSMTKRWVLATDLMYQHTNATKFYGNPGITETGSIAKIGFPSSEQISMAPAIEYNFSSHFGIIAGVWFSLSGRNTDDFRSYVFSFTFGF